VNRIAPLLAAEMATRQLNDRQTAEVIGVAQPTITRWRSAQTVPSIAEATKLAAFLRMKVSAVDAMIEEAQEVRLAATTLTGPETFGVLLRVLENERGVSPADAWQQWGIDKSRYYRLRADKVTPHLADIPDLSRGLGVSEERILWAAYRTELTRGRKVGGRKIGGGEDLHLEPVHADHV
jgi:transcriptional regulator with XRE-family HTH domain